MAGTLSASLIANFHANPMSIGRVICYSVVDTGDIGRGVGGGCMLSLPRRTLSTLPAIFRAEKILTWKKPCGIVDFFSECSGIVAFSQKKKPLT